MIVTENLEHSYLINTSDEIISPGLVIFEDLLHNNIVQMKSIAGQDWRLRPHCKTHKMVDIIRLEVSMGILKHKCATFAEAEMLAIGGAQDVLLAYNPVGPNIARAVQYQHHYPQVRFSVTADHPGPVQALNEAMAAAGMKIDVFVDINTGLGRTGLVPGDQAQTLYEQINAASHLNAAGLHVYDGQNHQSRLEERRAAVEQCWARVQHLKSNLQNSSLAVPTIVAGGTGTFPLYASKDDPTIELSPGTCVLQDAGYEKLFPESPFTPAALILTRVISKPAPDRLTFDLGYKACAADPPAGNRLRFPNIPDAKEVLQNEEHLVVETVKATNYQPGDVELAIPTHICPTSALHAQAWVIREQQVYTTWEVTARDRKLLV